MTDNNNTTTQQGHLTPTSFPYRYEYMYPLQHAAIDFSRVYTSTPPVLQLMVGRSSYRYATLYYGINVLLVNRYMY